MTYKIGVWHGSMGGIYRTIKFRFLFIWWPLGLIKQGHYDNFSSEEEAREYINKLEIKPEPKPEPR